MKYIVFPLISIIEFFQTYLELLIIYYLNPIYFLASDTIYFTFRNIVIYIKGAIKDSSNNNGIRFTFIMIAEILDSIGYLIYFEIIELRFCNLNEDLRKNIIERANNDLESPITELDRLFDEDELEGE